jgi:hypothetical protein
MWVFNNYHKYIIWRSTLDLSLKPYSSPFQMMTGASFWGQNSGIILDLMLPSIIMFNNKKNLLVLHSKYTQSDSSYPYIVNFSNSGHHQLKPEKLKQFIILSFKVPQIIILQCKSDHISSLLKTSEFPLE